MQRDKNSIHVWSCRVTLREQEHFPVTGRHLKAGCDKLWYLMVSSLLMCVIRAIEPWSWPHRKNVNLMLQIPFYNKRLLLLYALMITGFCNWVKWTEVWIIQTILYMTDPKRKSIVLFYWSLIMSHCHSFKLKGRSEQVSEMHWILSRTEKNSRSSRSWWWAFQVLRVALPHGLFVHIF